MKFTPDTLLVNRYKLIKELGHGGFADVWLAQDIHLDNLEVALKIFAAEKGLDDSGLSLFKKEFLSTRELQHPHLLVPSYFDVIEGSRIPFMVMTFCAGGSLASKVDESYAFSENEIIEILKQTCAGLEVLHSKDIVHRDIKPGNILTDGNGKYFLSDFGISGKMRATLTKATARQSYLTPAYSPPERYGKNPEGTPAGDIFSLGVAIYELCSGDLPWDGQGGIMVAKGAVAPTLPKRFSAKLNTLLEQCLANEPADRPTARQIIEWSSKGSSPVSQDEKKTIPLTKVAPQQQTKVSEKSKKAPQSEQERIVTSVDSTQKSKSLMWAAVVIVCIAVIGVAYTVLKPTFSNKEESEALSVPDTTASSVPETLPSSSDSPTDLNSANQSEDVYTSVTIGTQQWMARNLNVSSFANGDLIPEVKTPEDWRKAAENKQPAWCYYNNDPSNGAIHGKLYNWFAFTDSRGLAPTGWHLPSSQEFLLLRKDFGDRYTGGRALKSDVGWRDNGNGNNLSGFGGLPSGYRGLDGEFGGIGEYCEFWSRSNKNSGVWSLSLVYYTDEAGITERAPDFGFVVRCVKD